MCRNRAILLRFALVILLLLGQTGGILHALGHLQSTSQSGEDSLPDATFCGECLGQAQLGAAVPAAFTLYQLTFTSEYIALAQGAAYPTSAVFAFHSRAPPTN